tara:strand:+ start:5118 stop:6686 length:1569 start_codon:yes stop_codon:yes gene_type:complete
MQYPKALQPRATKNKDGKVISWRAMFADLDDSGLRKKFTWKSFPAKYRDEDGKNRTNSKNSVFQETVSHCEEVKKKYSDGLIDTDMTLLEFINEHYRDWRETTFVNPNVNLFVRFLEENNWAKMPLKKITRRWCSAYRQEIPNFKKENGKSYKTNNSYIRLSAELNGCLKQAEMKGYIATNYNDRIENPHKHSDVISSEKAREAKRAREYKSKSWTMEQLLKYFPKLMSIPETTANKVDRSNCKPRKANVKIDKGAYKTYWKDADGKHWSKSFNIKKLGDKAAKMKAEALAETMSAELAKEYEQGTAGFYMREKRTFDTIDVVMVRAYFTLSLHLGLRNGEISGLKFSDFDEKHKTVDIERQLVCFAGDRKRTYDDDKMLEVNPKKDSFRVISYNAVIANLLEELKAYHIMNDYTQDDYLLQYRYGGRVRPDYWTKHNSKFQTLAGIPKSEQLSGTHSGRHTHISILAQEGILISELQYRAGHSDIRTTASYYIHIASDKNASDTFENVFVNVETKEVNNGI